MDKFSEEVRRGVEVVQQVSEELSQIIQQVQTLAPNFETVSEGMQLQSLGAQQISDSLSQLSEAAKTVNGRFSASNRIAPSSSSTRLHGCFTKVNPVFLWRHRVHALFAF